MIKVFVQRGKLFEKVPDLVLQLGAKQGFSRFDCPGTADLSLPGEIGSQSRRIRHLWALVALGSNGNPCCRFRSTNQLQKFLGFCRNSLAEGFEDGGGGLPVEEAVGQPVTAQCYKRPKVPENPALAPYFAWKSEIGCVRTIQPGPSLFGPQLENEVRDFFEKLTPLYEYFNQYIV